MLDLTAIKARAASRLAAIVQLQTLANPAKPANPADPTSQLATLARVVGPKPSDLDRWCWPASDAMTGAELVTRPASKLTDPILVAPPEAEPQMLGCCPVSTLGLEPPVAVPARTCAGCQHLTRIRTCAEPVAAGLEPPPGIQPGADWFGIRWPAMAYGATCQGFKA